MTDEAPAELDYGTQRGIDDYLEFCDLLNALGMSEGGRYRYDTFKQSELESPKWDTKRFYSSWEPHVPEGIFQMWDTLPLSARLIAWMWAHDMQRAANDQCE